MLRNTPSSAGSGKESFAADTPSEQSLKGTHTTSSSAQATPVSVVPIPGNVVHISVSNLSSSDSSSRSSSDDEADDDDFSYAKDRASVLSGVHHSRGSAMKQDSRASDNSNANSHYSTPRREERNSKASSAPSSNKRSSGKKKKMPKELEEFRDLMVVQHAEEQAQLNRAILLSLQYPVPNPNESADTSSFSLESMEILMNMGFNREQSQQALRESRGNVELAANRLLGIDF